MIITTAITTASAASAMASIGIGTFIGIIAMLTLVLFLTTRELASTGKSHFSLYMAKAAAVGILPLAMTFAVIIAAQLAKII